MICLYAPWRGIVLCDGWQGRFVNRPITGWEPVLTGHADDRAPGLVLLVSA